MSQAHSNLAPDCPQCGAQGMAWVTHACIPASAITPIAPPQPLDPSHWLWKDGYQAGWTAALKWKHEQEAAAGHPETGGTR